ncbi:hypothetical protein EI427_00675 [Flammeovirga pectinis]|uniref:TonB-dependent receptor n=1 Tax=Flammeovirga pectinis TaxID=2494373 RepID=A0A3S9NXX0_9BACT|nr:hypothetical protein [Flammeovirga pectinis]AZQ60774.1 hypothetical protein EI427_00675 [Flammeovirga pectinis]
MKYLLTILLLFNTSFLIGQSIIQGEIISEVNEPINGASVIAYQIDKEIILGFSISLSNGRFKIQLKEHQDSVKIVARSLGYASSSKNILVDGNPLRLQLSHSDKYLKELEVKTKPITEEGDTLNYNVASFSKEGDESIEDVLKRMPGIEVSEDGKIQYQGKVINKFYVEGKDLMGAQYAITSKNLPKNAVASVEVLKNHQPVKMLNEVVHSVDPAINIVLKEGVSVTGNAEIGVGVPSIWYGKVTPMVFNKKHQTINVISSTNSGKDELSAFNAINLFDYLEFGLIESVPSFLLGKQPMENNLFKKSEYNDHQTHTLTTNYITGFGKGDLKVNIDAYYDKRFQELASNTFYFVPNDTIAIKNLQQSTFNKKYIKTKLTYEHNADENYFKNVFHFKFLENEEISSFYQNEEYIPQNTNRLFYNIGNKLSKIIKLGNIYYKLNAYLEYTNTPEQLHFTGGPLINSMIDSLQKVEQQTYQRHLKTFIGTSIIKKWKNITLDTKFSFNYSFKSLTSDVFTDKEGSGLNYQNDLYYHAIIPKVSPSIQYKHKRLLLSVIPNVSYQTRILQDQFQISESVIHQLIFEPTAYITYNLAGVKWSGHYSYNTNFLELPQMYSGIIINNYNAANQQELPILQTKLQTFRNELSYEIPMASMNFYSSYEYNTTNKDWISAYEVNNEGVTLMKTLDYENNQGISQKLEGNIDWFILALRTTIKGGVEVGESEENVILNGDDNRNKNNFIQYEGIIDFPIIKGLVLSTFYTRYNSENTYQEMNKVNWSQEIIGGELQFSKKKHLLKWNNKWINHTFVDDQFLYMDLSYQYKFNKKTKIKFIAQNLLNHQSYTQTNMNAYQSNQTFFYLRPRQLVLELKFSL